MQKPGLFGMNGLLLCLLTGLSFATKAEQPSGYLILVDAENKQPFVIRLGEQSYFSSAQGHLVLARLKDSVYKLALRYPRKNMAEQVFTVALHRKDLGFQLKGTDSSVVLFNWQTKEIIRPIHEKDSSRLLEQGIRRDDAFSRLMAAVVNDSAVMYDTYAGKGFEGDSGLASRQTRTDDVPTAKRQPPTANQQSTAKGERSTESRRPPTDNQLSTVNGQRSTESGQPPIANAPGAILPTANRPMPTNNKDSLFAARKQQIFLRDSLNTSRKAAIKDSMATVKKQQTLLKDSLVAARKATKDSIVAAKKTGGSKEALLAAKTKQVTKDSLIAVERENAIKDSLLAVKRANFIKDSADQANIRMANEQAAMAKTHHTGLTRIKKLREVSLKISRKIVFLDIGKNGRADTITLFVYFETTDTASKARPGGEAVVIKKSPPDSTGVKKFQPKRQGSDTIALSKTTERNKATDSKTPPSRQDAVTCSQAATERDTDVLRMAILKANSEEEKIAAAAGAFAMKCFSVSQVRFLASLLVSDKARYGLMDAAHTHVVDRDRFPELVDLLKDKNFQHKFLVMAEKRS
ncbi:MAG TPA: hypothetical protein VGI38_05420 [Puia sp.]